MSTFVLFRLCYYLCFLFPKQREPKEPIILYDPSVPPDMPPPPFDFHMQHGFGGRGRGRGGRGGGRMVSSDIHVNAKKLLHLCSFISMIIIVVVGGAIIIVPHPLIKVRLVSFLHKVDHLPLSPRPHR